LFCKKNAWNFVLKKGIKQFLDEKIPCIAGYSIEFNYESGENIRFAISCLTEQADQLAKDADEYFKLFFRRNDLPSASIKLPLNGIFLPFPCNSIQFGLYRGKSETCLLSGILSRTIIDALCDDEIDNESIVTLAFYLYLGVLRKYERINGSDAVDEYIRLNCKPSHGIDDKIFETSYEENRELFEEISRDVMQSEEQVLLRDAPWLQQWLYACEEEIVACQKSKKPGVVILTSLIDAHLGFTENMRQLLKCILRNVFLHSLDQQPK